MSNHTTQATGFPRLTLTDRLARLGGARPDVIDHAIGDRSRFAQMGVVILTTAGIAALSAGFALVIVGLPIFAAVLVGLGWGFAILNLDRLLIVSMPYQSGRKWYHTLLLALPRVILALIIGIVISTPLTLQIFAKEITPEVTAIQSQNDAAYQKQLNSDPRFTEIPKLQTQLAAAQKIVADKALVNPADDPAYVAAKSAYATALAEYNAAEATWEAELNGSGGTGTPGSGPVAAQKKQSRDLAAQTLANAQTDLDAATAAAKVNLADASQANATNAQKNADRLQSELAADTALLNSAKATHTAQEGVSNGILVRLQALDLLSRTNWIMGAAHFLLAALFVAIELLPVLMKTIMNFGKPTAYDRMSKITDDSLVNSGEVLAAARVQATQIESEKNLKVVEHRAELQRIEGTKLNQEVVRQQSAAVKAALKVWGAYAKERTTQKIHDYEQDLGGVAGQPNSPGPRHGPPSGFRPTAAPKPATYSTAVGLPDPDAV